MTGDILEQYRSAVAEMFIRDRVANKSEGDPALVPKADGARCEVIRLEIALRRALEDPAARQAAVLARIADALEVLAGKVKAEALYEQRHRDLGHTHLPPWVK